MKTIVKFWDASGRFSGKSSKIDFDECRNFFAAGGHAQVGTAHGTSNQICKSVTALKREIAKTKRETT